MLLTNQNPFSMDRRHFLATAGTLGLTMALGDWGKAFACGGAEVLSAETVEAVFGMKSEILLRNGVPVLVPQFE